MNPEDLPVEHRLGALEQAGSPEAIERALSDPAWVVRSRATQLASRSLSPERLVALASKGEDFTLRASAMTALARAGARAVPALLAALEGPESEARLVCLQVLGKIHTPAVTQALLRAAEWDDSLLAQVAIEALGRQAIPEAIPVLVSTLKRDYWRAMAAILALSRIKDPRALAALEGLRGDPQYGEPAEEALRRAQRGHSEEGG